MLATSFNTAQLRREIDEATPIAATFRIGGKFVVFNSEAQQGALALIAHSAQGAAEQVFFVSADVSADRAAEVLKKFLDVPKQHIKTGTVVSTHAVAGSDFLSCVVQMSDEQGVFYTHVFGLVPTQGVVNQTVRHVGTVDDLANNSGTEIDD
jgi:hypothetical protein